MRQTHVLLLSFALVGSLVGCGSTGRVATDASYGLRPATVPVQTAKRNASPVRGFAWGFRNKHHYRYYPEAQVYYAPSRDTYFWQDGDAWRSGIDLPDRILVRLHSPISLALETDEPWTEHEAILSRLQDEDAPEEALPRLDHQAAFVSD